MEISRILLTLLFLAIGIALFRGAIMTRLQLEKEVKGGRRVILNNFLPYWNADDFTERGNSLRKTYNRIYYALIVYSLALIAFVKSSE
jgi:hypothetical protein